MSKDPHSAPYAPSAPTSLSLQPSSFPGLTAGEVAERVSQGQTNVTPSRSSRSYRDILRDNLLNVFTVTVAILLAILIAMGEYSNTFFAGLTVVANTLIGLIQEVRAKQTLDRLAALAAGTVRVRRDGQTVEVPADRVVKDDLIEIEPGDKVVVDGPVVWSDAAELDESQVTGETDSVPKGEGDTLVSGSFVVAGRAIMCAEKIGAESFANSLNRTAKTFKLTPTPIQQKINAIVTVSVIGMAVFGPLLFLQGLLGAESLRQNVLNAVVLVTSFVPQGVVLATTLALTFGAIRISRQQALVQRINAIESMGNVTVLCFDKTGTLTQNRLSVTELIPLDPHTQDEAQALLAQYVGTLATQNKTAAAVAAFAGRPENPPAKQSEVSFTSARKWGATTFADGRTLAFGAPELLLGDDGLRARAAGLAARGLRVLALVTSPDAPQGDELPARREPVCLVVMQDVLRDRINETLHGFALRGIDVKVISGDSADTVSAIARSAGMEVTESVTERQLAALSPAEFDKTARRANVFARIRPETKRRIVAALTRQHEYVAMVGDGVNDVPALKTARLSIAMQDGAQMAKDVADIVLLNNALSTLLQGLREGNSTTQKIYATVKMFLTKNLYTVGTIILVGFVGLGFPADVRQMTWVTICTASIPSLLVTFGLLHPRPVRNFQRQVLGYVAISGALGATALTLAYAISYAAAYSQLGQDDPSKDIARSVLTIVAVIYGTIVFWDVHGVVPFEPVTFLQNRREGVLGILVLILGLVVPIFFPRPFNIEVLPIEYWAGILALSFVTTFLLWRSTLEQNKLLAPVRTLLQK